MCSPPFKNTMRARRASGSLPSGRPSRSNKERRQYVEHTAAVSLCSFVQVKDKPEPPPTGVRFGLSCSGGPEGDRTLEPHGCEPCALPAELYPHIFVPLVSQYVCCFENLAPFLICCRGSSTPISRLKTAFGICCLTFEKSRG